MNFCRNLKMKQTRPVLRVLTLLFLALLLAACATTQTARDPLPSWADGETKHQIIGFVSKVTDSNNESFVPAKERIATFDNDGTLWSEKPTYFQLLFILERVKAMAVDHPEWNTTQPFRPILCKGALVLNILSVIPPLPPGDRLHTVGNNLSCLHDS